MDAPLITNGLYMGPLLLDRDASDKGPGGSLGKRRARTNPAPLAATRQRGQRAFEGTRGQELADMRRVLVEATLRRSTLGLTEAVREARMYDIVAVIFGQESHG